jgi:hypothetical protein
VAATGLSLAQKVHQLHYRCKTPLVLTLPKQTSRRELMGKQRQLALVDLH